jgi:hypothetical protein
MNETLCEIWTEQEGHAAYADWSERSTIADYSRSLGYNDIADKAMHYATPRELISKFLNIIETEAKAAKRHDVLEQLCFAGLVYG